MSKKDTVASTISRNKSPDTVNPTSTSVTVTQVADFAGMSSPALDTHIQHNVKRCTQHAEAVARRVREQLLPALLEMKSRFEQQGARNDLNDLKVTGWHDYLQSRGINPATFRKWKQRSAAVKQLETIVTPPKPRTERKTSSETHEQHSETESEILAKAGTRLAKTLLDPMLPETERVAKAVRLATELQQAAVGGVYDDISNSAPKATLPQPWLISDGRSRKLVLLIADSEKDALELAKTCGIRSRSARLLQSPVLILFEYFGLKKGAEVFSARVPTSKPYDSLLMSAERTRKGAEHIPHAIAQSGFAKNENGKWEYMGKPEQPQPRLALVKAQPEKGGAVTKDSAASGASDVKRGGEK